MISVIIPSYQHASTLPNCLDSVFGQTISDVEIIVVNDGSTDNTKEVLQAYADRLTIINQENRGAAAARNAGFDASKGEFVIFCDADVIMRPDMLQKMLEALVKHQDKAYAYSAFRFGWKKFTSYPFSAERLRQMNFITTTSLIRRADFPRFDEQLHRFQDWDLWLTILQQGKEGIFIAEELFRVIDDHGRMGISQWRPSMMYRIPWSLFGWEPKSIQKYRAAREIIRAKHGLV